MSLEPSACEDLKAFERRLTEVIADLHPATRRWRFLLLIIGLCAFSSAWFFLTDPKTSVVPFIESIGNHPIFFSSVAALIILFIFGIHKLVIAPQIISARTRLVLSDFNMSCDETGKLILKPRPSNMERDELHLLKNKKLIK